jgi:hypothetical protein
MTLPRSAADVLSDHVLFEVESIDRLYCNLYVPQLQRAEGIVGLIRGHLGQPIASTAAIAPMSGTSRRGCARSPTRMTSPGSTSPGASARTT